MTGPSAGREVALDKDEIAVGRVGVQVAAVRRIDGTFRLVPLEGTTPPSVNGATGACRRASASNPGDSFEVAGVELEYRRASAERARRDSRRDAFRQG